MQEQQQNHCKCNKVDDISEQGSIVRRKIHPGLVSFTLSACSRSCTWCHAWGNDEHSHEQTALYNSWPSENVWRTTLSVSFLDKTIEMTELSGQWALILHTAVLVRGWGGGRGDTCWAYIMVENNGKRVQTGWCFKPGLLNVGLHDKNQFSDQTFWWLTHCYWLFERGIIWKVTSHVNNQPTAQVTVP